jgi:hypothetical protein
MTFSGLKDTDLDSTGFNNTNKQFPQLCQAGECIGWNHRDEVTIQGPARHQSVPTVFSTETAM